MAEVVKAKPTFLQNYRQANFISRALYYYGNVLLNAAHKGGKVSEDSLLDMSLSDNETNRTAELF